MPAQSRKVAIVTGAARGIGRAIALRLAGAEHDVVVVDLLEPELRKTVALVEAAGAKAHPFVLDVSDYARVRATVDEITQRCGRIDVLVNNAAMVQPHRIADITEEQWDRGMAVNLKSVFIWSQAVAPRMLEGEGGRIVNISSVAANTGGSPQAASRFAYAAAKAGVLGLTRSLAREFAPRILVNAVCPGSILTDRTRAAFEGNMERIAAATPLGRVGTPEDIAVVVGFLATAHPLFMTGEVIDVDGGANIN
ncbi:MAG: SDR family NAD(P)-dependent oxidoreductase [Acetobacteraceae bacterium]